MSNISILEMSGKEAKDFFLEAESYFSVPLPDYFDIKTIIERADEVIGASDLNGISHTQSSLKNEDNKISKKLEEPLLVNKFDKNIIEFKEKRICFKVVKDHKLFTGVFQRRTYLKNISNPNVRVMANKNGSYTWRPFTMIHPIIYVDLVNTITKDENWKKICDRFKEFKEDERIICTSVPVKSVEDNSNVKEQILTWWRSMEQAQIELALEFDYCIHTDITDCYPSIYTHSIAWAVHGKEFAKKNQKSKDIGNKIDEKIRNLQHGQTNGIPQGSVLMDFIAEIVLGYAEYMLSERIRKESLGGFKILRYRDDYRIFSKQKEVAERIMKLLSEVLFDLNLKINSKKTFLCEDIIIDGIKDDKLYWSTRKINVSNLSPQKHLLEIKLLGDRFPNCGQLMPALKEFYENRIVNLESNDKVIDDVKQLISIATSIMMKNPRTIQNCVAIIHKLLEFIEDAKKHHDLIELILKKYEKLPNTDLVEIWIQNISVRTDRKKEYKNLLCQKVADENRILWKSSWLKLKGRFNEKGFINNEKIKELKPIYIIKEFKEDSSEW